MKCSVICTIERAVYQIYEIKNTRFSFVNNKVDYFCDT